ncbi:MAG: hypothetical protein UV38_C0003G0040 [candidate division TM6 bacterium GW2011_GWE2_42_60]|nr:MAG: hypothetical protein UV38_C0003G0040 [candidate division TM6 bacterium GW2011_GWE2_42_60]HBY05478.1 hypothetical protein [Candidatus Dependentiae bacterium]
MTRRFFIVVLICNLFIGFAAAFGADSTVCDRCKVPFDGADHLRVPLHSKNHVDCKCAVCKKCLHDLSMCPSCKYFIAASSEKQKAKQKALFKVVEKQGRCSFCGGNRPLGTVCTCGGGRNYLGSNLVDFVCNMVTTAPLGGFNMLQHLRTSLLFGSLGVGCGIFDFYLRRIISMERNDDVGRFCCFASMMLHGVAGIGLLIDLADNDGRLGPSRFRSQSGENKAQLHSFSAGFYIPVAFDILRCAHQHRLPSRALAFSWQMIKRAVLKKS